MTHSYPVSNYIRLRYNTWSQDYLSNTLNIDTLLWITRTWRDHKRAQSARQLEPAKPSDPGRVPARGSRKDPARRRCGSSQADADVVALALSGSWSLTNTLYYTHTPSSPALPVLSKNLPYSLYHLRTVRDRHRCTCHGRGKDFVIICTMSNLMIHHCDVFLFLLRVIFFCLDFGGMLLHAAVIDWLLARMAKFARLEMLL